MRLVQVDSQCWLDPKRVEAVVNATTRGTSLVYLRGGEKVAVLEPVHIVIARLAEGAAK